MSKHSIFYQNAHAVDRARHTDIINVQKKEPSCFTDQEGSLFTAEPNILPPIHHFGFIRYSTSTYPILTTSK